MRRSLPPLLLLLLLACCACLQQQRSFRRLRISGGGLAGCRVVAAFSQPPLSRASCLSRRLTAAVSVRLIRFRPGLCELIEWCGVLEVPAVSSDARDASEFVVDEEFLPSLGFVVFSLGAASGVDSWDLVNNPSAGNASVLLTSQTSNLPQETAWRSTWMGDLAELRSRLGFTRVCVDVIAGGARVMRLVFDATFAGIDSVNWFASGRLVSWEPASLNLGSQTFEYFAVSGYTSGSYKHRFYVGTDKNTLVCERKGFLNVIDNYDGCTWSIGARPIIKYNLVTNKWYSASTADKLVITVY